MFTLIRNARLPVPLVFLILLAILFGSASGITAQSTFPPKLDIEEAIEKALANNPQTRVCESRIKIADLKIQEAKTGKKPSVQFSQSIIRSNNPVFVFGSLLEQGRFGISNFAIDALKSPNGLTNFRSLISSHMPLFDQHQTKDRVELAAAAKSQAELQAESVRQQLRFDVVRNFYGAVLGKEMLKVSDEAVRSAQANRKKTKDMVDVGMTTDADFLAAEVELANAGQQRLEAESQLTVTTAALNLLLGDKPEFQREIIGDLQEKYFPVDDQDESIRTALANRPDYLSSELAIKNSKRRTKAVKDLNLPKVDAFGNFGYSSPYIANGSTDYTVGVSLTYTLFDAGRKARSEQAVEAETLAESEKNVLANQISLSVVRAFQDHKTAKAKIQVSIKSITQAEEGLRIVQDRYRFGLTTFNEVIRSESALVRAKHNLLTARYEYYVSYASLLLATGKLADVRLFD
ncbi:MAG: TolC family protein [Pyrinomonadaceae bacterium]